MRKMKKINSDITINVERILITKNMWEHFITDEGDNDYRFALVMGFETELGDVYLPELRKHKLVESTDLAETMPAIGWQWVD